MPTRIASFIPKRLIERRRASARDRGAPYATARHRAWRAAVLLRDNWQCRVCGRVCGSVGEAHADHIVPLNLGGDQFSLENGQALCLSCHSKKTCREMHST